MVKLACPGRASVLADNFVITKKKKSFSCIVDYSMILSELVQNKIIQTDLKKTIHKFSSRIHAILNDAYSREQQIFYII